MSSLFCKQLLNYSMNYKYTMDYNFGNSECNKGNNKTPFQ